MSGIAMSGVASSRWPGTTLPVVSADQLHDIARKVLEMTSADTAMVRVDHLATGVARVARGHVRLNNSGDTLRIELQSQFGHRLAVYLSINQIDVDSLRKAVAYLERFAREQPGDPVETAMPIPPRTYLPNTTWHDSTVAAFQTGRHEVIEPLVAPVLAARLNVAAFVGVAVHSTVYGDKRGLLASGQETDSELTITGWDAQWKGSGWAGQAARDWTMLRPDDVAARAIRLTNLAANPVRFEPGRRTVILDRPAVAQIAARMGRCFNGATTLAGIGPLYDHQRNRPKLGEQILDARISISCDPSDPDGGYLPFNPVGYPLIPMRFVERGVLRQLAFPADYAADLGVTPANDPPDSLRIEAEPGVQTNTVDEMIANCREGIYINRLSQIEAIDSNDGGAMTGLTNGGCYLVRHGKIEKAVRNFRFTESPWHFLTRVEAIGTAERASFGYSPWIGDWPVAPMIVPPMMIRDFNLVGLADNA